MTRSAMLEVLREDYIRTARAKGLVEKLILIAPRAQERDAAGADGDRASSSRSCMGGLVVTEQVFNLNGLGLLFVQAVAHRDYTLTQALVLLVAGGLHRRQLPDGPHVRAGSTRASGTASAWRSTPPIDVLADVAAAEPAPRAAGGAASASSCRRRPLGAIGAAVIVLMLVVAVFAPILLAPYDPLAIDFGAMLAPPSAAALARHRRLRPRRALAPHLRLAHGAAGGLRRRACVGATLGRHPRRRQRLLRRAAGPLPPARAWTSSSRFPLIILALAVVAILGNRRSRT